MEFFHNLFHRHHNQQASQVPLMPQSTQLVANTHDENLEQEELTVTAALNSHLNALYSKIHTLHKDILQMLNMHEISNAEYLRAAVEHADDAEHLFAVIYSEADTVKETAILFKRKLMQHHELHSDNELLKVQDEAFTAMSFIRSHYHRIEEILSLIQLTFTEFKNELKIKSAIKPTEELREMDRQLRQAMNVVVTMTDHVSTLAQIESDIHAVEIKEKVHKDIVLEVEDTKKLANVFKHLSTITAACVDQDKLTSNPKVTENLYEHLIHTLEQRVLPTLQRCMKYESAIFQAVTDIDERTKEENSALSNSQYEVRIFSANLRSMFTDINSKLLVRIKECNRRINLLLDRMNQAEGEDVALKKMANKSAQSTLNTTVSQGTACIEEILTKLNYLDASAQKLSKYVEEGIDWQ